MSGNKSGQPSAMAEDPLRMARFKPFKPASSDNDSDGGVSLAMTKSSATEGANPATATVPNVGGHDSSANAAVPQTTVDNHTELAGDYNDAGKAPGSGSQLNAATEPFTPHFTQPMTSMSTTMPLAASNLTATAEAFVPSSSFPPVVNLPFTTQTQTPAHSKYGRSGFKQNKHVFLGPQPAKHAAAGQGYQKNNVDKPDNAAYPTAFASQFEASQKLIEKMRAGLNESSSTGSSDDYDNMRAALPSTPRFTAKYAAHGFRRQRANTGQRVNAAGNVGVPETPNRYHQAAGYYQHAGSDGRHFEAAYFSQQNDGLQGNLPPMPSGKDAQETVNLGTPSSTGHKHNLSNTTFVESNTGGTYDDKNGPSTAKSDAHARILEHLKGYASQRIPTNFAPAGYRAGLPGSASDGMLAARLAGKQATGYASQAGNDTFAVAPPENIFLPPTEDVRRQRSRELNELTGASGVPSIQALLDVRKFPFRDPGYVVFRRGEGVIHMTNIAFGVSKKDFEAKLGKPAKTLPDSHEGIHILIDYITGKTVDAFIETVTMQDAMAVVGKHQDKLADGQQDKILNRPAEMSVSSPDALRKAVFKAGSVGVKWIGGEPQVQVPEPGQVIGKFKAFVPAENLTMLLKHAENQTTFSRECPERPYECMISILMLMPWKATQHITIKQRHQMYETVVELIRLLKKQIWDGRHEHRLTRQLLDRLVKAAMLCPGFTVLMKDNIAELVGMDETRARRDFNQPRFANQWRHQYATSPKPGVPLDVLEYYIALVREETQCRVDEMPISDKQRIQELSQCTDDYWGYFWLEVDYPVGPAFDDMTLAEAARRELSTIEAILRRAVSRQTAISAVQAQQQQIGYY
ncbi:hypothetical protein DL762_008909 [Monosporascus cannonballus]|uniref:Uncharacterized protein n=1 Tax=Monosporascus cannonballus TaxID=155416 RepID=A0ABY0GUT6_9PEZI|nr:hypothetical protein DL762_008909 [Monosporascus cannonballus]